VPPLGGVLPDGGVVVVVPDEGGEGVDVGGVEVDVGVGGVDDEIGLAPEPPLLFPPQPTNERADSAKSSVPRFMRGSCVSSLVRVVHGGA
jgi:hypothetical protein